MSQLNVAKKPCSTCPYRKDVPSGVWNKEEYEKLRKYDEEYPLKDGSNLGVFLCHQTNVSGKKTACKGWCVVHQNSIAFRLAQITGVLGRSAAAKTSVPLHESGNAAADFGEKEISRPTDQAVSAIEKLRKTGKFKE